VREAYFCPLASNELHSPAGVACDDSDRVTCPAPLSN
jgi:hypothetical protein